MKRHSIDITRQCAYRGVKGRCKRKTSVTHPYCGPHTKSEMGLSVRKSNIAKAGLGLFAERAFKKDEQICEYTGDKLTIAQYDKRYGEDAMGSYGLQLNDKYVIDAAKTTSGVARYACDFHGSRKRPNAEYVSDSGHVYIVAIRNIKLGDEIYTDYGDEMHRAMGL